MLTGPWAPSTNAAMLLAPLAAVTVPADLLARATALGAAPWSKSVPAAVLALVAPGPRRFLPAAVLLGSLLVTGLAGLAAGWELTRAGHDVTILEAQLHPGGRVHTIREGLSDDLYAEAGAGRILHRRH